MSNDVNAVVPQGFYMEDNKDFVADLTRTSAQYCSKKVSNEVDKAILFNAINSPEKRLGDCINETIMVEHVFVESVTCTNEKTGEETDAPRIVLIDPDGAGYACVSLGVYGSISKLFAVWGEPTTWSKPLPIKVKQITKGEKKLLNLTVDTSKMGVIEAAAKEVKAK